MAVCQIAIFPLFSGWKHFSSAIEAYAAFSVNHTERSAGFLEQFKSSVPQVSRPLSTRNGPNGAETTPKGFSKDFRALSAPFGMFRVQSGRELTGRADSSTSAFGLRSE